MEFKLWGLGGRAHRTTSSRRAAPVVALLALLGSLVLAATPASASAGFVSISTSMVGSTGNVAYEWSDPAPAGQVTLKLVSTTTPTNIWVFGLSSDVRTSSTGTVTFNPVSMINTDPACTMCITSKVSGPSSNLTNDTYVISMSYPDSAGGTTTSAESTLAVRLFVTFSTTLVSTTGRATYEWADPAPAGQVTMTFVSATSGTTWVFGLSSDVQTTKKTTLFFTPTSMINTDPACTVCVTSKVSGPTTYLPNDVYVTSMSFLNNEGSITTSLRGSLTTALFTMPAKLTPASNTTAGTDRLTLTATVPMSVKTDTAEPWANNPRFVVSGTGACAGKSITVILANPVANVAATVTISYADPPSITSTVTTRGTPGGNALVRGCSYDVRFLYQSALMRPPLPSNADGSFAVTTSTGILIPDRPTAPTIGTVTAGDGSASVAFTAPSSDGGSAVTGYTVTSDPGGITASGTSSPIEVSGLTNGTSYTFSVAATNGVGTSPASVSSSPATPVTSVVVTAGSPTTVAYGTAATAVGYTTSPVTAASDWTAEPTCELYAATDTTYATPLSGVLGVGTYTTHCAGGTSHTVTVSSRVDGSFTVTEASAVAVTATASATSYTYGGTAPEISYSAVGFENGESFSTSGMTAPTCHAYTSSDTAFTTPVTLSSTTPAGTYVTHCSGGVVSANYATPITYTDGSLTIDQATPNCTVTGYTVTFDGTEHTATGTCLGVDGGQLDGLDLSTTTHTDADTYTDDPWTFTDTTGNYTDTTGTVTNTIDQATPNCTVTGYTATFDGTEHTATGSCLGVTGGQLDGLDLTTTTHTDADTYTDDPWTFTDTTGNYTDTTGDITNTIDKAVVTITPDAQSVGFGDPVPEYTYQAEGFVEGDGLGDVTTEPSCTSGYTASTPVAASPLTITCTGGVDENYRFDTTATAALEITQSVVPVVTGIPSTVARDASIRPLSITLSAPRPAPLSRPAAAVGSLDRVGILATPSCTVGRDVVFRVSPAPIPTGPFTAITDSSGTATTAPIQFMPGVSYRVTVTIMESATCQSQTSTSTMTVTGTPGRSTVGRGTYTVAGTTARVRHQVVSTTSLDAQTGTRSVTYRGRVAWTLPGRWRFTGTASSRLVSPSRGAPTGHAAFVTSACSRVTAPASGRRPVCGTIVGTGTLMRWDPPTGTRRGRWVTSAYGTVGFMATVDDGGTTRTCTSGPQSVCTTRARPDRYALTLTDDGRPLTLVPTPVTPTSVTGNIVNRPR